MGTLRFLLALSVAVYHFEGYHGYEMMPGWIEVDSFFVISGFYMALILAETYPPTSRGRAAFYLNRYLRLFPAYAAVLLLSAAAFDYFGTAARATFSLPRIIADLKAMDLASAGYVVLSNVTMIGSEWASFLTNAGHGFVFVTGDARPPAPAYNYLLIPQGWSLGVELAFYAVAPFLLRLRVRWLIIIAAGSLLLREYLSLFGGRAPGWTHSFVPAVLFLFLSGALSFRLKIGRTILNTRRRAIAAWIGLVAFILLFALIPLHIQIKYVVYLVALVISIEPLFELTKNLAWDRFLGELSYPIYLVHFFVAYLVDNTLGTGFTGVQILGTLALAVAVYWALDRNVEPLRHRLGRYLLTARRTMPAHTAAE